MSFGTARRLSTLLAAGAAFAGVAVGGHLHPAFVVAWYVGLVAAWFVPDGRVGGRWVLATALVGVPVLVAATARGMDMVVSAVAFAAALLLARVVARDGPEAHGQAHLLSVVLLAGGAALSGDVTYLAAFIVFVFALVWALLLNQVGRLRGEAAAPLPLREVVGRGLGRGVFALTAVSLLATGATFVFFPRTTFGLGFRRPMGGAEVGLSDRIELSGFGRLKANERPVIRVTDAGVLPPGMPLPYYWRAHVLEDYDGTGWRSRPRPPELLSASGQVQLRRPSGGPTVELRAEVLTELSGRVIPVPDKATVLRLRRTDARGRLMAARRLGPGEVHEVGRLAAPYRFRATLEPERAVVDGRFPEPSEIELPPQDPRVESLAALLWRESGQDVERYVSGVETYLQEAYRYSDALPGADPSLEHFLFDRRAGHCEYFATAMAVLLRLRGIPARIATGFVGGTWNEEGGFWTVRQSSAHAWVEAWHDNRGWMRHDPTPPEGRGAAAGRGVWSRLEDVWDAAQARWSRFVLDYDLWTQWRAMRSVRDAIRDAAQDVGDAFRGRDGRRLPLAQGLLAVAALALAVALVRRRGLLRRGPTANPRHRQARRVHRALVRAGEAAGVAHRPGDTPEDLLAALRARHGARARALEPVVRRYQAARFGGRPLGASEASRLAARAREVGRELARPRD